MERKKYHQIEDLEQCTYFIKFIQILNHLKGLFERLKPSDLVYESESILKGEINAFNQFLLRTTNNGNSSEYSVEDLLFDEFFEAEKFADLYEDFIAQEIEKETEKEKITSLEEVEDPGK
jgi:hypothetical protein